MAAAARQRRLPAPGTLPIVRAARSNDFLRHMMQPDFAPSVRALRRHPAFTLTATITLALGIGASTAIFSVTNAVLLRPLPYANPGRLFVVQSDFTKRNTRGLPVAPGDLADLRARVTRFSGIAGVSTTRQALTGDDAQPEQVQVANVTTNLFSLLGVNVAPGRDFTGDDGVPPAAAAAPAVAPPSVVILGHEFWLRRYGGASTILGRTVTLGTSRALVVGVAPAGFELLFEPSQAVTRRPDVYSAMRIDWESSSRTTANLNLIARLRDGATIGAAQGELDAAAAELRTRFAVKEAAGQAYRAEAMAADAVRQVRPALLALMGAALCVLLIACGNVANLLLVRASGRETDEAVRAALGATSRDLVRRQLAEAFVMSVVGGVAGLLLAMLGISLLGTMTPANLPRMDAVSIDGTVLAFTVATMLVATSVVGVIPALRASRPDLMTVLRRGGRMGALAGGRRLRQGVVVAQVALAYALLSAGGLMIRSYVTLTRVNPGYDASGLVTFSLRNARAKTPAEKDAFTSAVRERISRITGVQAATAAFPLPLDGNNANLRWGTDAAAADPSKFQQGNARFVLPGYFAAMRTPVLEGRDFTEADNVPEAKVVVIDRLLAAKEFPNQSAVGRRLLSRFRTPEPEWFDVIGVVAHERHESLARDGRETLFFTDGMIGHGFATHWALRTTRTAADVATDLKAAVASIDPLVPVAELKPMSAYVDDARATTRFALFCLGVFAAIAVVLAGVGLFGTLAAVVRQRTTELGMRMALGATGGEVFRVIAVQGLVLTVAGIGFGIAGALALARVMASLLVGVAPTDAANLAAAALALLALSAFAAWIPARRAARLEPAGALREETARRAP